MVNEEQKTIKEAANRLKINYSTAKHIIKSKKQEVPPQASCLSSQPGHAAAPTAGDAATAAVGTAAPSFCLPAKHGPPLDI